MPGSRADNDIDVDIPRQTRAQASASLTQTRSRTVKTPTTKIGPPVGYKQRVSPVKKTQKVGPHRL
jgi:hypothetical protein